MAFNLWNGWCYESEEDAQEGRMSEAFTPDNLFCCELPPTSMRQSSCGIQNIRTAPGSELSKAGRALRQMGSQTEHGVPWRQTPLRLNDINNADFMTLNTLFRLTI